jgi:hypothetical protein
MSSEVIKGNTGSAFYYRVIAGLRYRQGAKDENTRFAAGRYSIAGNKN